MAKVEGVQPQPFMARVNAAMSPVDIQPGMMLYGEKGLDYRSDKGGYIFIPWQNVEYISVEIALGFYYRGFIVKTDEGHTFEFVGGKVKKALPFIRQYLKPAQIRQRVTAFQRMKKKWQKRINK
ncbi:DUF956 family protein [Weissella ceti]|uniref:DUF956 family protein n=1 Tax=Weissella ceti TaxID=759620 RepID=UPI001BCF485E|nr:DUF956 family protein [Weissella ceti]QVK11719.1 DUF956 family protein [Weissella ceti]